MRQRDAKIIKIFDGEDSAGKEIEIPLSTLHAVSGSVLEAATGRTVNAAHVSIHYTDDDSQLVSTTIAKDDIAFHFLYVPEGEYTLKVKDARDVVRTELPNCVQCIPPTRTEEKTVRTFGNAQQPLILHTDVTGLTIAVPAKPATAASTPAVSAIQ